MAPRPSTTAETAKQIFPPFIGESPSTFVIEIAERAPRSGAAQPAIARDALFLMVQRRVAAATWLRDGVMERWYRWLTVGRCLHRGEVPAPFIDADYRGLLPGPWPERGTICSRT